MHNNIIYVNVNNGLTTDANGSTTYSVKPVIQFGSDVTIQMNLLEGGNNPFDIPNGATFEFVLDNTFDKNIGPLTYSSNAGDITVESLSGGQLSIDVATFTTAMSSAISNNSSIEVYGVLWMSHSGKKTLLANYPATVKNVTWMPALSGETVNTIPWYDTNSGTVYADNICSLTSPAPAAINVYNNLDMQNNSILNIATNSITFNDGTCLSMCDGSLYINKSVCAEGGICGGTGTTWLADMDADGYNLNNANYVCGNYIVGNGSFLNNVAMGGTMTGAIDGDGAYEIIDLLNLQTNHQICGGCIYSVGDICVEAPNTLYAQKVTTDCVHGTCANFTGNVSAAYFYGDASNLVNVPVASVLGTDLDGNGYDITNVDEVNATILRASQCVCADYVCVGINLDVGNGYNNGCVCAYQYYGDGSQLSNLPAGSLLTNDLNANGYDIDSLDTLNATCVKASCEICAGCAICSLDTIFALNGTSNSKICADCVISPVIEGYHYGDGSALTGVIANLTPWNTNINADCYNLDCASKITSDYLDVGKSNVVDTGTYCSVAFIGRENTSCADNSILIGNCNIIRGNYHLVAGYCNDSCGVGNLIHGLSHNVRENTCYSEIGGAYHSVFSAYSHTEGYCNTTGLCGYADGLAAHAEGKQTAAYCDGTHAQGIQTHACGVGSFTFGCNTYTNCWYSVAGGVCSCNLHCNSFLWNDYYDSTSKSTDDHCQFKVNSNGICFTGGTFTIGLSTAPMTLFIYDLPTSDPTVAGQIWNNSGVLTVSNG